METTNAVRNYGQAEAVQSVVRAVYHHWMTASPSKYPPNLHSRVESRDGAIVRRDYKKLVGIGIKEYKQFKACDAKYVELIWEFTPDGQALEKRMVVNFKIRSAHQTYWSFGSCNSCWKQGRDGTSRIHTLLGIHCKHPLTILCCQDWVDVDA